MKKRTVLWKINANKICKTFTCYVDGKESIIVNNQIVEFKYFNIHWAEVTEIFRAMQYLLSANVAWVSLDTLSQMLNSSDIPPIKTDNDYVAIGKYFNLIEVKLRVSNYVWNTPINKAEEKVAEKTILYPGDTPIICVYYLKSQLHKTISNEE
jgi:hypothetical protein